MLGGYQIINLSNIDLTIGTSQVSITDKDVLAQLRELREHIEDNYNFAIPLNRKLKPVLLRLRDKKNGEKQEVSIWANLSIITNNKTFKIEALVDSVSMKAIQIEVVFQQLTDDDGNKYWDIKTAKYLYTENIGISVIEGDLEVGGDLTVTGSINGEENPSVKPLYFHPISIYLSGSYVFTMIIINNNPTAFTKETLSTFLKNEETRGRYLLNGGYYGIYNDEAFYLSPAYVIYNTTYQQLLVVGVTNKGQIVGASGIRIDFDDIITNATTFEDAVNKIN